MANTNRVDILLVEDSPQDRELTLLALQETTQAKNVQVVGDGAEMIEYIRTALAVVKWHPEQMPRMILLDLKLPKVDGLEVLKRIKSDERTKSIPIVVLTSSREESDVARAYELGANSYVVKPVDFDSFERAVTDLGQYWLGLNTAPK